MSDNWVTWYERLTKGQHGFSFNKRASVISYVDRAMREEFGDSVILGDNLLWTRENLRTLKDQIVNDIQSKITKK